MFVILLRCCYVNEYAGLDIVHVYYRNTGSACFAKLRDDLK